MDCGRKCLFCEKEQDFKVNFAEYHGVCENCESEQGCHNCIHCGSSVPILKNKPETSEFSSKESHDTKNNSQDKLAENIPELVESPKSSLNCEAHENETKNNPHPAAKNQPEDQSQLPPESPLFPPPLPQKRPRQ